MKTLYLVRHAKSSWKDLSLDDFDRPLNDRGERDAPKIGAKLQALGIKPDRLVSSPALRARQTAVAFAKAFGIPKEKILFNERIYHADLGDLLDVIQRLPEAADTAMIFGHNPEFTWLANKLGKLSIDNIPTSGVVCLAFNVREWEQVDYGLGRQQFFMYPKQFR
jgi:phosphohistidine phosphatase